MRDIPIPITAQLPPPAAVTALLEHNSQGEEPQRILYGGCIKFKRYSSVPTRPNVLKLGLVKLSERSWPAGPELKLQVGLLCKGCVCKILTFSKKHKTCFI